MVHPRGSSGGSEAVARPALQTTQRPFMDVDFNLTPFTLAWEITRACALACVHCRAEAQPQRNPQELTTEEGFQLIDGIVELGGPLLVITGGDPLMRRDVFDLIRYGTEKGLRLSLSPAATALLNQKNLQLAKDAGVARVHISLDGSSAEIHDTFRQTPGSYQRTVDGIGYCHDVDLSLQVGTTVTRHNKADLPGIAEKVAELGAVMWSVFFLVPTGRGQAEHVISAQEHEEVFNWLYDLSKTAPFDVRTTAAMHYRRVTIQRKAEEDGRALVEKGGGMKLELTGAGYSYRDGLARAQKGVNDGNGFCFVSHIGEVMPSGFLPLSAGSVRETSVVDLYRDSEIFRNLRDTSKLKGKCGRCEFNVVCGGSRGRAYAMKGDYLESEPCCIYEPSASPES